MKNFNIVDPDDPFTATQGTRVFNRHHDFLRQTLREAVVLVFLNVALSVLLVALGLTSLLPSNANLEGIESLSRLGPLQLVLIAVVVAPVLEETLFRGLPFWVWRTVAARLPLRDGRREMIGWIIGGATAICFALAHGIGSHTIHLPLPQLLMGFWLWHVINRRGMRYSILLHGVYNLIPALLVLTHGLPQQT